LLKYLANATTVKTNARIKAGETPVPWTEDPAKPMLRQKDLDSRWTRKNKKTHAARPSEGRGLQEPHQRRSSAQAGA